MPRLVIEYEMVKQSSNIGLAEDLSYKVSQLGNNPDILKNINSEHHEFGTFIKKISISYDYYRRRSFARSDSKSIINNLNDIIAKYNLITKEKNGFNVLHNAASRVGALDIGFILKRW